MPQVPAVGHVAVGGDPRPCTREFALLADPDGVSTNLDRVVRTLEKWCVDGAQVTTRNEHMSSVVYPRDVPQHLPSNEELDQQLARLRPMHR